ncbi:MULTISPECIES: acetyl-CoA carboxylase biotin carboxyl carrier protein subunit [Alteribacter]|uniref:Acetyl-CoA carboxylase biotin carboxyl carrier protein subunit n=1 Tax=Alteribacter keqinensis TaxID=2483800 RepID=A0A3M7TUJ1_9BACI|nr:MULTISPECIES: acetyl-CoA carboxylase biotin carboxyl carrier protein subunit [Alteribacter]MBM7097385.1 acetyl-CoA carboxylase biotin carboxyl carrier protein subunit [Alteribacter salitolerans]RNA68672.1 acetyl-CoA carboxylase biotin carboxyl carrier protein subunit [Alteribacter keqinensis]
MKEVKTNMAGNVWKVQVAAGDEVTAGQEVVILESMKMEIPITAEEDGTVEEVKVEEGSFVNEDDVLLTLK